MDRVKALSPTTRLLTLFATVTALSVLMAFTVYSHGHVAFSVVSAPFPSQDVPSEATDTSTRVGSTSDPHQNSTSGQLDNTLSPTPSSPDGDNWTPKKFEAMERSFHNQAVNCSALFAGDEVSIKRAVATAKVLAAEEKKLVAGKDEQQTTLENDAAAKRLKPQVETWHRTFRRLTEDWYLHATKDCDAFKQTRGYVTSPLSRQEEEFPIAFSMLVFKDLEMVERLLRSVYRPQNRYCIHVDAKTDDKFFTALQAVVACFPDNVRMSSRRVNVQWGKFSVLEPELICMKDLLGVDTKNDTSGQNVPRWKYFINLTGQEFPLKSNHELVKILKAYKGANNEEGTRERANKERWKSKPPHGIIPTKGGVHTVLNRATVDYIVNSPIAHDFIAWLKTTGVPDETLFASLNYNPQLNIPGTYNGTRMESGLGLNRYKQWYGKNCYSHQVKRSICIISTGDLPRLGESPHLFANKFYLHQDRIVIGCLEEKIFNDTRDEFLGTKTFNTTFYAKQDFVLHQVPGDPFR